GLNLIIPIIDKPRKVIWVGVRGSSYTHKIDLRETVLDVPEQAVITKDNVNIHIDALLYVQITSPKLAAYEIAHLPRAVSELAQTTLRNVIGEMDLDESLASRDLINSKLKKILDEATDKWGTKVNRVELKNISPPPDIQAAMEKQMQAERERRAKVLQAEGDKQSRIARSEGQKQEKINLATGDKEAQVQQALGEAEAIREVATAKQEAINKVKAAFAGNDQLTSQFLVATDYLKAFDGFNQKPGDKVFVPYEASTVLSGFGAVKDLLGMNTKG
ncbi:MAG: SPFH domain-containing protein, partial [Proteobacteria bacterium]|nr:SPFH domain-containing protein [Pseudomonadota bacterium]